MKAEITAILKTVGELHGKVSLMENGQGLAEQLNVIRSIASGMLDVQQAAASDTNKARFLALDQLEFLKGMIMLNEGGVDDVALLNISAAAYGLADKTSKYIKERNQQVRKAKAQFFCEECEDILADFPSRKAGILFNVLEVNNV